MRTRWVMFGCGLLALTSCANTTRSPDGATGEELVAAAPPVTTPIAPIVLPLSEGSSEDASLTLTDVEALPGGDLIVAGMTDGATPLVPEATGTSSWWGLVARLTPEGVPVWVHRERQARPAIAATGDTVHAAFLMEDGMLRPVGDAPERSGSAAFLRALDASDGQVRWSTQRVLGGNPAMTWGLELARQGDALVVLAQVSNVSLIGDTPVTHSAHIDTALSWYDAGTGAHRRTDMIRGPKNTIASGLAFAPDGDVVLAGTFHEEVTLGDATMGSVEAGCGARPGDRCGMLARIGPGGEVRWTRGVTSSAGGAKLSHVVRRGDGFVFAGEVYHGEDLDLGLGARTLSPRGESTVFVAEVDGAGATRWEAIAPTSKASLDVAALRALATGEVALALTWDEVPNTTDGVPEVRAAGRTLQNHGGTDLVVLGVSQEGAFRVLAHLDAAPHGPAAGVVRRGHASALALTERGGTLVAVGDVGGQVTTHGAAITSSPWSDDESPRWGLVLQLATRPQQETQ